MKAGTFCVTGKIIFKFMKSIPLNFYYQDKHYQGEAITSSSKQSTATFPAFDIFLNDEYNGTIVKAKDQWASDNHFDSGLIAAIGLFILC